MQAVAASLCRILHCGHQCIRRQAFNPIAIQLNLSGCSYNTYNSHYKEVECYQQQIEDLLYKYGVDFIFFGHVHAYERTNRVYNYANDPCGPVHIIIGDGGNVEGVSSYHNPI